MLELTAAAILALGYGPTAVAEPVLANPLAAGPVARWQILWDGAAWRWLPNDCCPYCGHHVQPEAKEYFAVDGQVCPECGLWSTERTWESFNLKVSWWRPWPSDHEGKELVSWHNP